MRFMAVVTVDEVSNVVVICSYNYNLMYSVASV